MRIILQSSLWSYSNHRYNPASNHYYVMTTPTIQWLGRSDLELGVFLSSLLGTSWRYEWSFPTTWKIHQQVCGGFQKWRYPIAGWFIRENPSLFEWMRTGGSPMSTNHHVAILKQHGCVTYIPFYSLFISIIVASNSPQINTIKSPLQSSLLFILPLISLLYIPRIFPIILM